MTPVRLYTSRQRLVVLGLVAVVIVGMGALLDRCFGGRGSNGNGNADDQVEVNPYLDVVPDFPPPPEPEPVTLPEAEDGTVPVIHSVPTDQPVVFITIDDGVARHPDARLLLEAAGVPTAMFLLSSEADEDPDYFADLVDHGSTIQAHTINHPKLQGKDEDIQEEEICGSADQLESLFATRPTLFRPPYGAYDDTTLEVVADCDMTAVVHWRVTVDYGEVELQPHEESVQPGDILLLHFRDDLVDDLLVALEAIAEAGLTPARLEDYLREG